MFESSPRPIDVLKQIHVSGSIPRMKQFTLDHEIRARIDSFAAEVSSLVKIAALEAVHDALGASLRASRGTRRGPGRPKAAPAAPKAAGKRAKRTSEDVLETASSMLTYIKSHPGQRLEQIGAGIGKLTKDLKLPIQKLFEQKAISTKGVKRGTKYFAR